MRKHQLLSGLWTLFLLCCLSAHVEGREPGEGPELRTLKIATGESTTGSWRVRRAEVLEDVTGEHMRLEVLNASHRVAATGRFYAEYYDASLRRCLTAIFDLNENPDGRTAGVSPGGTTVVFTSTYGLFPSSEPESIRVYAMPDQASFPAPAITPDVDRPASVAATSRHATDTWHRLCLDQAAGAAAPPALDLLLAKAQIDESGQVTEMNVLRAVSPRVQAWFQDFAPHLRFRPARQGLRPRSVETLLLVRALMPSMRPGVLVPPPCDIDWVRQYVEDNENKDLPWINVVLLNSPPSDAAAGNKTVSQPIPTSVPLCLEYDGTGTGWSVNTADAE